MGRPGYQTNEDFNHQYLKFFFVSKGKTDVIKAIEYRYVNDLHNSRIFNLGFGDYDIDKDEIDDSMITDNGDVFMVFDTVLNTIPKFFNTVIDGIIMVQGSDSGDEFIKNCKPICKKRCDDSIVCKNQNRRIMLYQNYVNKNFKILNEQYKFYGGTINERGTVIEDYIINKQYNSVFVGK